MSIGMHNLKPAEGSHHRRKRLGRGIGSGHGKTSTRGHKGNKARGQINPNFEGGQTPLHRRLPQVRGFKPVNKKQFALVNVETLEEFFDAGAEITLQVLIDLGMVRDTLDNRGKLRHFPNGLKVLGNGEVTKAFTVRAHKFSRSAQEKLQAAGGTIETLPEERR